MWRSLIPFIAALPMAAQVSVLTYQYDLSRAGANLRETTLNPSNVNAAGFGKLFSNSVDGYVYAQPLYMPNVNIPGKGLHNVLYVAAEHDNVYAFDADGNTGANAAPLWQVSFLNPTAGVTTVPYQDTGCGQIIPEIGITGTPVIDPQSGTIYVVAMTKESGTYVHRLHALDIATGQERSGSPVTIQATYPGTGEGGSTLTFRAKDYKQRPGLLLLNGVVYTGWSSHCDIGAYHGWLIGYDARTLQQVSVYNSTPNGNLASFWNGGAAPAADANGNIYIVSGNGTFDYASGGPDLGESYIKLSSSGGLKVADYFTPFNYSPLNNGDVDTGSAGVALLPDDAGSPAHPHLMTGAGKEGRIYLLDRDRLGGLNTGSDSQIVQSIPNAVGGLFGNPAYFSRAVYFCGANDNMKMFSIAQAQMTTAPSSATAQSFGFPGCVPSISANGTNGGVLWALDSAGVLHAYDASSLAKELYNSAQNPERDGPGAYVKFSTPTIANGKVYAGFQNALVVYGLLNAGTSGMAAANAASGERTAVAPGSIASIFGQGLAQATAAASGFPLPATLASAAVTVNGIPAPLLYVSPTQINFQVPPQTSAGTATVAVSVNGSPAGAMGVNVQPAAPGIFLLDQQRAAALNQDNSTNSVTQPAVADSAVSLFVTGLGAVDPPVASGAAAPLDSLSTATASVTATVGGQPATVIFAGLAPGFAGLYQVNIIVPQLAPGNYPVQLAAGSVTSNQATITVR
jgi:uncharacterized protein (TIGR03437 family)